MEEGQRMWDLKASGWGWSDQKPAVSLGRLTGAWFFWDRAEIGGLLADLYRPHLGCQSLVHPRDQVAKPLANQAEVGTCSQPGLRTPGTGKLGNEWLG